jgi:transposase
MQSNSTKFARRYDREFKENDVALIQSGRSITEVSRDLGVSHWSLSRWLKDAQSGQVLSKPRTLSSETPEQRELRRLRQENDYLRRQRDISKNLQHLDRPRCSPAIYGDGADESITLFHRKGRRSGDFQERFFRSSTQRRVSSSSTGQRITGCN